MTHTTPSHLTRGYAVALLSAAFLSTTAIFIRHLTETYQVPALVLAFWRALFVAGCLLPALWLIRPALLRPRRSHLGYLAAYGLLLAVFNTQWTLSVAMNGAAVATVLVYSSAAFTTLLGRWLLKEPLSPAKLAAVAASLGGCVLVAEAYNPAAWQSNFGSILVGMFSGLWYAIYSLMGRSAAQRGLSAWTTLLYTFAFAAAFLLLFNLALAGLGLAGGDGAAPTRGPANLMWLGDQWAGWGVLFLLAAGPTIAGFGLYNVSLVYLPSSVANLVVTLEPAFTAAVAYLLLGERLSPVQLSGGLLILAGVALLRWYEGRQAALLRDR